MLTDSLGNAVTLRDAAALPAVNDFVEGIVSCEARVANILKLADTDASPIVQAYCAALHMFAESRSAPANAKAYSDRASQAANSGDTTPRERRFIASIAAWVAGDTARAIALHEEQALAFPRDLASLKLGQYHLFNRGDSPGLLRLALTAMPGAGDVAYLHGMAAFGFEQCHQLDTAEQSARQAMRLCRHADASLDQKEPWAHHALAHVMLTQGRMQEGHGFMAAVSPTWTGLNSFMFTHNWWHQALFAIELREFDEALGVYDGRVWGVVKTYSQDQVNAISLLSRLELRGVDVGGRWQDVASHVATRLDDQVLPFLDLHYLYALARAGRSEADRLLQNITRHARATQASQPCWQQVALPAATGLLAHARGQFKRCADALGAALPQLEAIGGSHAQRDWFVQLQADAVLRQRQS